MKDHIRLLKKIGTTAPADRSTRVVGYLCLCLFAVALCRQALAIDRDVRLEQLSHTAWLAKDGAPSNVNTFAQTSDGTFWIGTSDGLYRFDGIRFMRFHPSSGPSLPEGGVHSSMADPDGSLWVGFAPDGISHIKGTVVLQTYTSKDGLPREGTRKILRDRHGDVWALNTTGLARLEGARWNALGPDWNISEPFYLSACFDRKGNLWVGAGHTVYVLSEGSHKFQAFADHVVGPRDIAESPAGVIWVAELGRSVHPLKSSSEAETTGLSEVSVGADQTLFDSHGSLWIGSIGDGLRRVADPDQLNGKKIGQFDPAAEIFTKRDGLSGDFVSSIFEDREGNIWTASLNGIDRFRQTPLLPITLPEGKANILLAPGMQGNIWVGFGNKNAGEVTDHGFTSGKHGSCTSEVTGATGRVWLECHDGLIRIDDHQEEVFQRSGRLAGESGFSIAEDSSGVLWSFYPRIGLFQFDGKTWTEFRDGKHTPTNVLSSYGDAFGHVWFIDKEDFILMEDKGKITQEFTKDEMGIGTFFTIKGLGKEIWIGGRHGVGRWQDGEFHKLLPIDKDEFSLVSGLVITQRDGLWLESGPVLTHIVESELDRWRRGTAYRVASQTFDALDGLTSGFVHNMATRAVEGSDGRLWFASEQDLFRLDPRTPSHADPAPSISILSLTSNSHSFSPSAAIRLPAHTTGLQIEYTAWSLAVPERVRFRYRLPGVDKDWQDAGSTRTATYTNLDPGTYHFEVIASNGDGKWSPQSDRLDFYISPAFYQTAWFKVLEMLAGIALIWLFIRLRIRLAAGQIESRMTERLLERDRIARELHDTLLQGFQSLMLRFQLAANAMPSNERARTMLEDTLTRADVVLQEGRERVRDLRSQEGNDLGLADFIAVVGDELSSEHPATFRLFVLGRTRPLHRVVREELEAIAKEALTNAFVHSQADQVVCEIAFADRHLLLTCRDNGVGIPAEYLVKTGREGHWGLVGMGERATKIGAKMRLTRGADEKGTVLEVRISARIAYAATGKRWFSFIPG